MAAICGRWVMQMICLSLESCPIFSETFHAVLPLIPVSISSKIKVAVSSLSANTVLKASMIRDNSPPLATCQIGRMASPGFTEIRNSILSYPSAWKWSGSEVTSMSNCTSIKLRSIIAAFSFLLNGSAASFRNPESILQISRICCFLSSICFFNCSKYNS